MNNRHLRFPWSTVNLILPFCRKTLWWSLREEDVLNHTELCNDSATRKSSTLGAFTLTFLPQQFKVQKHNPEVKLWKLFQATYPQGDKPLIPNWVLVMKSSDVPELWNPPCVAGMPYHLTVVTPHSSVVCWALNYQCFELLFQTSLKCHRCFCCDPITQFGWHCLFRWFWKNDLFFTYLSTDLWHDIITCLFSLHSAVLVHVCFYWCL